MWKHNIKFHQLSYREMEHLRQVWAGGRYPEVHGKVIEVNQDLIFSFLSYSPLTKICPLLGDQSIELNESIKIVKIRSIQRCSLAIAELHRVFGTLSELKL